MAENSKIEWCDHTWNPWIGCAKVAAGCQNCYAEKSLPVAMGGMGSWGKDGARHITSDANWKKPFKWNEDAMLVRGIDENAARPRIFCGSLCDVFEDRPDLREPRARLMVLIEQTPELDWLLLTKRPENVTRLLRETFEYACGIVGMNSDLPKNVWLGTSVACQEDLDRNLPHLAAVPATVRFLSVEPLIDQVDLCLEMYPAGIRPAWVIVGGESGGSARPCNVEWVRSIVKQCKEAEVPVFVKQLGSKPYDNSRTLARCSYCGDVFPCSELAPDPEHPCGRDECPHCGAGGCICCCYESTEEAESGREATGDPFLQLSHPKGGDPDEWPPDLRVREFPEVSR